MKRGSSTIPFGTLLLTTDDATIASGLATNDPIWLFEPDVQTVIDSYTTPINPGNGISVEKIDYLLGDLECTDVFDNMEAN